MVRVVGGRCGVGVGEVCLVFLVFGSVVSVGRDRMTGWGVVVVGGGVACMRGWLAVVGVVSSTAVVRM